jgi:hypothetical protein
VVVSTLLLDVIAPAPPEGVALIRFFALLRGFVVNLVF